ncbi:tripartite tricarboxylate transporter substrate binding protein [Acidovorax sp. SRB_24]|uniref:Bug family tripartite tricarboxylate transporter substrate binding protein n=1 Tax=Acidovorax sp. SRB_24 TaxID=1962700 RepID=UPI00145F6FB7|nr:tripartite tricarboxylate transporter substrate binding protein [Acidovorax sp. SRB_24]NMM78966.1 ABC transporter substrate-binding protein [Acidovorax sp. SRB_24]
MTEPHYLTRRTLLAAGAAAALPATVVHAQNAAWPSKGRTVRFIVPFVPGGTSDIVGRAVTHELTRILGTTVMVDNKAGGGGIPAMLETARAPADGYTLIQGHVGSLAVNPFIYNNPGYDVNKDFVPVTLFVKVPSLFVAHPSVPANNLQELVEYSKKNPTELNYASAGNASAGHLAMEYLKLTTGLKATHIPYRGTGPALNDLMAGRIQLFSAGTPALGTHIKKGTLRGIATGTKARLPSLPQMPTVAESGYPGFESVQWYGMLAPAGTPPDVVKRLQLACAAALKSPAVAERFAHEDAVPGGETPEQFAAFIASEQKRWKDIVAKAGIRAD